MADLVVPPVHPRRLIFLGTPDVAVPSLRALVEAGFDVALVVSGEDARRGRRASPSPSPVKATATEFGIPVTTRLEDALDVDAELGVVVAFGRIIAVSVLQRLPMVNLHFSKLPRWRGAAPVERAILAGDRETGVCVMGLAPEVDSGDIYRSAKFAIDATTTADSLRRDLAALGAEVLLAALTDGLDDPRPQIGEVTYAHKILQADLELDFQGSADELARVVRVGGAWTWFRGERFKIWGAKAVAGVAGVPGSLGRDLRVATTSGSLVLEVVQPAGKPRVEAKHWVNGARLGREERFGL